MKTVDGIDCVYYLFNFLPLSGGNETGNALQEALVKVPGSPGLVQVTVDTYSQFFMLVSRVCTQVQGSAVRLN